VNNSVCNDQTLQGQTRRRIIVAGAAAALSAPYLNVRAQDVFAGGDASLELAQPGHQQGFWEKPRWVWLKRQATGEQIKLVYWQDGQIIPQAHSDISWFLRDVRFERMLAARDSNIRLALNRGVITEAHLSPWTLMDPILIDILYAYSAWLQFYNIRSPLLVTSGFRHLITNLMTEGAARDSWHMRGGAGDILVPGVNTAALARFGQWLAGGGVGLYTSKNFIHIDRGRVRSWLG
jgi:uncharacterized protein YcbK (DUF882 family)